MHTSALHPLAITMWDFSWIERRWPGAGFEDWDCVLDELADRGYDAVRIDAFPHLVSANPHKEWTLLPVWNANDWGSPYKNRIRLWPELPEFIRKCRHRGIRVALSSWYREDTENTRMGIRSPAVMAENWIVLLRMLEGENLLDALLYVDLCNEWPGDLWAPYFENEPPWMTWACWHTERSMAFIRESLALVRAQYPQIPLCYSFDGWDVSEYYKQDLSCMSLMEHHIWMAQLNDGEFRRAAIGPVKDPRFTEEAYHRLADNAYAVYAQRPVYWKHLLAKGIRDLAKASEAVGLPLATTECWGIVDYKDYPLLSWDWIRELCELGVRTAVETGRWALVATSNFAAPQFVGMWRDAQWHRELTRCIHNGSLPLEDMQPILVNKMAKR